VSRRINGALVWAFHNYVEGPRLRKRFLSLGKGKRPYTMRQKEFALSLIDENGVRATSRILKIPRRTVQRWCRQCGKEVKRCPDWVRDWALRRRGRREFWRRRGYY
jgi:hypothetical protein